MSHEEMPPGVRRVSGNGKPGPLLRSGTRKGQLWVWLALIVAACGAGAVEPLDDSVFDHSGGAPLDTTEGTAISFAPFPEAEMRSIEYSNPYGDRV